MIKLYFDNDKGFLPVQSANLPTVYLDTWALIEFTLNKALGSKFRIIMLQKKGTILISYFSLYEICKKKFSKNFDPILELLEGIDFAFNEFLPGDVIKEEDKYKKIKTIGEYINPVFPKGLISAYLNHHNPLKIFTISEAFDGFREESKMEDLDCYTEKGIKILNLLIQEKRDNEDEVLIAENNFRNRKNHIVGKFPFTKILWYQCLNYLVSHKDMNLKRNDWIDIFNTIVPAAYCDFVLIDGRWRHFIEMSGLNYPKISKIYSKSKRCINNIDVFFEDIEKYNPNIREKEIGAWM